MDKEQSEQQNTEEQSEQQQAVNTDDATGRESTETESQDFASQNGGKEERRFTQAELEAQIKERLERERAKQTREAQKQQEAQEAAALEAQAKWEELANKRQSTIQGHEARIAELEPAVERAGRYEDALKGYLAKEREGLPEHITEALDAMGDVVTQLNYISKNREALIQKNEGSERQQRRAPDANNRPKQDQNLRGADRIRAMNW
jgi:hypothetical protein